MDRRLMNTSYLQGRINDLHKIHNQTVEDYGALVQSVSQECEIFCELIPSYRINAKLESSAEGGDRKKKEVFNIERLEHELLKQYEHFLQMLKKLSKKSHPEQQALGARQVAKLVSESSAPEFNHSETLLTLAVHYANAKATRVAKPVQEAIQKLLDSQMVSDATEHIVHAILSIVRKERHALNPKILNLLLYIRVAMIDTHRRDITEEKAKQKRLKKQDKELARQMMKAQARRDRAELSVKQTRIIHSVFVIYLRVLQASQSCSRFHQAKILAPALEGLAKFAPLVNVEHYELLMKALRELVDEEDTTVTTKLHALVAVACLAQKDVLLDASAWRVDLTHFHDVLYGCIQEGLAPPKLEEISQKARDEAEAEANDDTASQGSTGSIGTLSNAAFSIAASMAAHSQANRSLAREWGFRTGLVVRAVDLLILTQKFVPTHRVIAIIRRLMILNATTPAHINISVTSLIHRLLLRNPAASSVILGGNDNYLAGKGSFNPDANDMATANADCSFTWELPLLQQSFHPTARDVANSFARHYSKVAAHINGQAPVVTKSLDMLGPYEVLERYDFAMGDIHPAPPHPDKRHGNRSKLQSQQQKGPAVGAKRGRDARGDEEPSSSDDDEDFDDEGEDDFNEA